MSKKLIWIIVGLVVTIGSVFYSFFNFTLWLVYMPAIVIFTRIL